MNTFRELGGGERGKAGNMGNEKESEEGEICLDLLNNNGSGTISTSSQHSFHWTFFTNAFQMIHNPLRKT